MSAPYVEPTLFDDLEAAVAMIRQHPTMLDGAHIAGDLVVQDAGGHFAMESLPRRTEHDRPPRCGSWVFLDMGSMLDVVTCRAHGNSLDPSRARALGLHLIAWADCKVGAV